MIAGPVIAMGGVLLRAFRVPTEVPIGHWLFDVPLTATVLLLFVAAYTHWSETRKKDEERMDQEKAAELLNRDQEAARLRATIARLETEAEAYLQRLTPQLRID